MLLLNLDNLLAVVLGFILICVAVFSISASWYYGKIWMLRRLTQQPVEKRERTNGPRT